MQRIPTYLLAGAAILALTVSNRAQNGGTGGNNFGPPGGHRPPPNPILKALDLNGDGELSADEIAKAPQSLLTLDKNGDGKLSGDELRPPPPPQGGQNGGGPPSGPGSGRNRRN